jgi:oxygen-dependent protoporphyrinogen oxidase
MAGMAAAFELRRRGHAVTLYEKEEELGGRCRTHFWRGAWRIRGAYAFVSAETNLVEQAKAFGIYESGLIENRSEQHVFRILRRGRVHDLRSLAGLHIASTSLLSASEKARLLAALPMVLTTGRTDPLKLDHLTAAGHFRQSSPAFVDYVLEPVWGLFCGYTEEDYSLAWLAWLLSRYDPDSNAWWTFREEGVGRLSRAFQDHFCADEKTEVRLGTRVTAVQETAEGVSIRSERSGERDQCLFDAAVVALPGPHAASVLQDRGGHRGKLLANTRYSHHDVVFVYLDTRVSPRVDRVVLPAAEGYRCAANFEFERADDSTLFVYGETKGDRGGLGAAASKEEILQRFLADVCLYNPALAGAPVVDAYVERNDFALPSFGPGFMTLLDAYRRERPSSRVALAGDWLLNTSVGSAHLTGMQAANIIDTRLRALT